MTRRVRNEGVGTRLRERLLGMERSERWRERHGVLRMRLRDWRENRRHRGAGPSILVVAEGACRHFYPDFLAWLAKNDPELRSRIHLDRLPTMLRNDTRVVHGWLQDPVLERNPTTFAQMSALEEAAREAGARVVQPVRVLSHSQRNVLSERLRRVGLRSPRVTEVDASFPSKMGGLTLPITVRRRWGHGLPILRLDTPGQVAAWAKQHAHERSQWTAAEFIEVRSPDGYYRKYRYVMAGNRGLRRHLNISPRWEVRPRDRIQEDFARAEELEFIRGPCTEHEALDAARRALEFDVAACDYSYDPEGRLVVWELNPFPNLSLPARSALGYLKEAVDRTNQMLADFYRDELAAAGVSIPSREGVPQWTSC